MINGVGMNNDPNNLINNELRRNTASAVDQGIKNAVEDKTEAGESSKKTQDSSKCMTCQNRRYVDGSDDPGVSFKTPTKMTPEEAATGVLNHEMEHYTRENDKAERDGRKVISNSIQMYTAICPECGKVYISGGVTRTTTASKREEDQAEQFKKFFDETLGNKLPHKLDKTV